MGMSFVRETRASGPSPVRELRKSCIYVFKFSAYFATAVISLDLSGFLETRQVFLLSSCGAIPPPTA
jgi:hypothetical protein